MNISAELSAVLGVLALVCLASIIAVSYALRELSRSNRELANRLMARDLTEYTRCKPILTADEPKPSHTPKKAETRRKQHVDTIAGVDEVGAQAAFNALTGGLS